jgi:serine protease
MTAVDSDTNDPLQQGRTSNSTPASPQSVGNPALVIGYVNLPLTGPAGPNRTPGDISDYYRVNLTAGQVVELNFGDATVADVDLYIWNSTGTVIRGSSIGITRSECVRITQTAEYLVEVYAYDGASNYQVAWGPVSLNPTCPEFATSAPDKPAFVPGQLLVKAREGVAGESRLAKTTAVARKANLNIASLSGQNSPVLLELPADAYARAATMRALAPKSRATPSARDPSAHSQAALARDTTAAIKELRASGEFEYVESNDIVEALQVGYGPWTLVNDTLRSSMPHLDLIKLPDTFNALNSLSPLPSHVPIVAVIDTGIVANHPELTRMIVPGYDFVSDPNNSGDGNGIDTNPDDSKPPSSGAVFHGTHVAGTIAAETFNSVGVVGVAPMARIMPVRVLGSNGSGTSNDVVQGMLFAAGLPNNSGTVPARKADVINLSLGGAGACPSSYLDAIQQVRAQGVIVVAAAGNSSGQPVGRPANCPGAIAVSALAYSGVLAYYSNVGPEVVVTAPGGDASRQSPVGTDLIQSTHATFSGTTRTPNYTGLQGTSMATPHVAGVMALMRAVNPNITPAEVDTAFVNGSLTDLVPGQTGRSNQFGFGMINALKAITAAGGSSPPPAVLPTLALSATRLNFGTITTQLQITLTRINSSNDFPVSATDSAASPNAVTVTGLPDAGTGPYVLTVNVNRGLLNAGEVQIQVEITSDQSRTLRFDVAVDPPATTPTGLLGVGPVYVLAVDPNTLETVAQTDVVTNSTNYPYTLANIPRPVIIVAGTDTDNDGYICGASEPCGAYPVLGVETTILSASRSDVSFDLTAGGSAASLSIGGPRSEFPTRGFRIR